MEPSAPTHNEKSKKFLQKVSGQNSRNYSELLLPLLNGAPEALIVLGHNFTAGFTFPGSLKETPTDRMPNLGPVLQATCVSAADAIRNFNDTVSFCLEKFIGKKYFLYFSSKRQSHLCLNLLENPQRSKAKFVRIFSPLTCKVSLI